MPKDNQATEIAQLRKYADMGEVVELPGFEPDQTVHFKLRRNTLRGLIKAGKIPNPLMPAAQKLYEGSAISKAQCTFKQTLDVMEIVVRDAMVSPTLTELEEAGVEMSEEQYAMIFSYAQQGARALEPFRSRLARNQPGGDGKDVPDAAQ